MLVKGATGTRTDTHKTKHANKVSIDDLTEATLSLLFNNDLI